MGQDTLSVALEREHHEIDQGIQAFVSGLGDGADHSASLMRTLEGLRRHIYLEEEFLFPPMRETGMLAPIFVMLREHGEMWRTLDALEAELNADAGSAAVQEACGELAGQLERHNAKEEPIIYPQADSVMSAEAAARLRAFLDTGTRPPGWVCTKARAGGPEA